MVPVLDYLPRGDTLDVAARSGRHRVLVGVLLAAVPIAALVGLATGAPALETALAAVVPLLAGLVGVRVGAGHRVGPLVVAVGLGATCAGLVAVGEGAPAAQFSFFVLVAAVALYRSWIPFAGFAGAAVVGTGLAVATSSAGPLDGGWWLVHGTAVVAACAGVAVVVRLGEDEQQHLVARAEALSREQVRRREFTSELLLNLARRNQSMFHRQLEIINDLEERERDPDVLADLFRLDHLATRVRRNAESLLVLSGEQPARVWSGPVALRDVVRAGVAETEELDRVTLVVDERLRVVGSAVADLTHVVAELVENAVRSSPPSAPVVVQSRADRRRPGAFLLVVEDTGSGMPPRELAAANDLLARPQDVDAPAATRRLGFHVVSRLVARHGIEVSLTPTPGCGVTAVIVLPPALFAEPAAPAHGPGPGSATDSAVPVPRRSADDDGQPGRDPVGAGGRHGWPGGGPAGGRAAGASPAPPGAHAAAPGAEPPEDRPDAPDAPGAGGAGGHEHGLGGARVEAAVDETEAGGDGHTTVEHPPSTPPAPAPRRGLIHPIVVPPPPSPAGPGDDPDARAARPERLPGRPPGRMPAAAPPARRAPGPDPAAPGRSGIVLARRTPQTHLAPELVRPGGPPPAGDEPTPTPPSGATPPDRAAPSGLGAVQALSAYQASRAVARSEIDGGPTADRGDDEVDAEGRRGPSDDGDTTRRQP
ncbi:sensor histidine kinase [Actinomycetospora straminea]|uniref:histidine kinase n=1 Tax=Actinomycetospora straminea TaxID=663607 RepID=A0ABP9DYB8_9PSEU